MLNYVVITYDCSVIVLIISCVLVFGFNVFRMMEIQLKYYIIKHQKYTIIGNRTGIATNGIGALASM